MSVEAADQFETAVRRDGRYSLDAYYFLHRGLERAAQAVHGAEASEAPRHVSGQQLCQSLREMAIEQWGPMARTVLARWNIRSTRDFGEMVYFLIGLEMMGKQDSDRISDFDDVYDFDTAFSAYEIPLDAVE